MENEAHNQAWPTANVIQLLGVSQGWEELFTLNKNVFHQQAPKQETRKENEEQQN